MALGGVTGVISEGGETGIGTVSSLPPALNFALGTTEGSVTSPLLFCVIASEKFRVKYPGH